MSTRSRKTTVAVPERFLAAVALFACGWYLLSISHLFGDLLSLVTGMGLLVGAVFLAGVSRAALLCHIVGTGGYAPGVVKENARSVFSRAEALRIRGQSRDTLAHYKEMLLDFPQEVEVYARTLEILFEDLCELRRVGEIMREGIHVFSMIASLSQLREKYSARNQEYVTSRLRSEPKVFELQHCTPVGIHRAELTGSYR